MHASAILALPIVCALAAGSMSYGPLSAAADHGSIISAVDTDTQLRSASSRAEDWVATGRTPYEERFSPIPTINATNISRLGIAWSQDLGMMRGQEATPLMINGVLYVGVAWSVVKAYDAQTGAPLWTFDPEVPRDTLVKACCDAVNRGVAYSKGRIFVGTLDGRLVALDARTGARLWSVVTVDQNKAYTITGAPRIAGGNVIIGNGGAELATRGYVSAYDEASGKLVWRFYLVPGDPSQPAESRAMAMAMPTWSGDWWKQGGGGNAWDSFAYDPALDLLYIGTGNGAPWARSVRSPKGGDNLFLSSIVAVRADTGDYVWHYQTTPGDDWDYTATQHMILATLPIGGRPREVIMQAPKNGFFYVLDRRTGELLSARNIVPVNWASHVDMRTGRPVENPAARYDEAGKPFAQWPSARGAHSWQPMSMSSTTGYVYIPVQESAQVFTMDPHYKKVSRGWNVAAELFPNSAIKLPDPKAYLLAWDPVNQREAWRAPLKASGGGVLSTAGNIVFQGNGDNALSAYAADTGRRLWSADLQGQAMAAPMSYAVKGEQFVAIMVGCGGDFADQCGLVRGGAKVANLDRLIVFKLDGHQRLPPAEAPVPITFEAHPLRVSPSRLARGKTSYDRYCSMCHGPDAQSYGLNPDLRASRAVPTEMFYSIVLDGALKDAGMASFKKQLNRSQVRDLQTYLIGEANKVARRHVDTKNDQ